MRPLFSGWRQYASRRRVIDGVADVAGASTLREVSNVDESTLVHGLKLMFHPMCHMTIGWIQLSAVWGM